MYTTTVIPGFELLDFIKLVGVLGVALVIFAESGLLIGFFLPGDSLLFATGFLTYSGFIPLNVHLVVLIMFLAAVLGDSVGYAFGRRVGPRMLAYSSKSISVRRNNFTTRTGERPSSWPASFQSYEHLHR